MQALRRIAAAPLLRRCGGPGVRSSSMQQRNEIVGGIVGGDCAPAVLRRVPPVLARWASTARGVPREADHGLLSVLRTEIEHERKTYSQREGDVEGPPKPWTLTDKAGHADVILRRTYGEEDIALTCVFQPDSYDDPQDDDPQDDDDSREEPQDKSCVNMIMTINKGGLDHPSLEISVAYYGDDIAIDHVYFWEDKAGNEATYDGPRFLELDEEVQNQFEKFVRARGVNRELANYLFILLQDKEQREYTAWLQKVEAFIRK